MRMRLTLSKCRHEHSHLRVIGTMKMKQRNRREGFRSDASDNAFVFMSKVNDR